MPGLPAASAAPVFRPPPYLRNAFVQTLLGSKRPGRSRCRALRTHSRPVILRVADRIRLGGALSTVASTPKGLLVLLHGWEGSIESTYVLITARRLFDFGFNIFRLNFRDHGETHHLNEGLFYATALDEVYQAVMAAARLTPGLPVFLCGFSLGGNYALRIARSWSKHPGQDKDIDFRQVTAISPVLDPSRATDAIDADFVIRRYFRKKWIRSLKRKQRLFPQIYDFKDVCRLTTLRQITEILLARYSDYPDAEAYFDGYAIRERDLEAISIPTTVITSRDDPIIPVDDFYRLSTGPCVELMIHAYGGHNGFISSWRGGTWYENFLLQAGGITP